MGEISDQHEVTVSPLKEEVTTPDQHEVTVSPLEEEVATSDQDEVMVSPLNKEMREALEEKALWKKVDDFLGKHIETGAIIFTGILGAMAILMFFGLGIFIIVAIIQLMIKTSFIHVMCNFLKYTFIIGVLVGTIMSSAVGLYTLTRHATYQYILWKSEKKKDD